MRSIQNRSVEKMANERPLLFRFRWVSRTPTTTTLHPVLCILTTRNFSAQRESLSPGNLAEQGSISSAQSRLRSGANIIEERRLVGLLFVRSLFRTRRIESGPEETIPEKNPQTRSSRARGEKMPNLANAQTHSHNSGAN